ncbi:MAG: hypothetical protein MR966_13380 [Lachnospiraceae bacterium]|nr:hypothetical protein [Lachnospiraceae bacterium]
MYHNFFRSMFRFSPEGAGGAGGTGTSGASGQSGNGGAGGSSSGTSGTGSGGNGRSGSGTSGSNNQPSIDYDRIQQMLDGTLQAKEKTALKKYFEQQGLTQQQAQQAIDDFKAHQAANAPDVSSLQTQLAQAKAVAQRAAVENAATMQAIQLGVDTKNIPYVLKLADLSQVTGQDGKINEETLKAAINKVLEDVPALKKQENASTGFVQVGASGSSSQAGASGSAQTQPRSVPTKRWNRFN